jgi:hypothetical protein
MLLFEGLSQLLEGIGQAGGGRDHEIGGWAAPAENTSVAAKAAPMAALRRVFFSIGNPGENGTGG